MIVVKSPRVLYGAVVTTSVAKVVGVNVRALRKSADATLDQFATVARRYGLPWSTGRVGTLESGGMPASLETLYAVAAALGTLIGREVTLAELLATDDSVRITDGLSVAGPALSAAVRGQPVKRAARLSGEGIFSPNAYAIREADQRMCKSLGVDLETGTAAMLDRWRKPFTAERDLRAGPDANAQRRGIIARRLKAELQEALTDGND